MTGAIPNGTALQRTLYTLLLALLLVYPSVCLQWGKPRAEGASPRTINRVAGDAVDQHTEGVHQDAAIRARAGFDGNERPSEVVYPGQATWIQDFCRTPGNEFFAEARDSVRTFCHTQHAADYTSLHLRIRVYGHRYIGACSVRKDTVVASASARAAQLSSDLLDQD